MKKENIVQYMMENISLDNNYGLILTKGQGISLKTDTKSIIGEIEVDFVDKELWKVFKEARGEDIDLFYTVKINENLGVNIDVEYEKEILAVGSYQNEKGKSFLDMKIKLGEEIERRTNSNEELKGMVNLALFDEGLVDDLSWEGIELFDKYFFENNQNDKMIKNFDTHQEKFSNKEINENVYKMVLKSMYLDNLENLPFQFRRKERFVENLVDTKISEVLEMNENYDMITNILDNNTKEKELIR